MSEYRSPTRDCQGQLRDIYLPSVSARYVCKRRPIHYFNGPTHFRSFQTLLLQK